MYHANKVKTSLPKTIEAFRRKIKEKLMSFCLLLTYSVYDPIKFVTKHLNVIYKEKYTTLFILVFESSEHKNNLFN